MKRVCLAVVAALLLQMPVCGADPVGNEQVSGQLSTSQGETTAGDLCISGADTDPSAFVVVEDENIVREIRYRTSHNFTGSPVPGYRDDIVLLTRPAAQALKKAARLAAKDGYRLKIYDSYRPQQAVDGFMSWAGDAQNMGLKEEFYPDLQKNELFRLGYVARKSSHTRGSAVDLTLVDADGKELDMGGTYDYFGRISHYGYSGISKKAAANRAYLRGIMDAAGFRPLFNEWWHFSLKKEPYPQLYFRFPLEERYVKEARPCYEAAK
ncbi:MAG: M15 family metallopeptidase [Succinivibrionaceae bacterium]|nr:M15 family metallopeptidase [Succinivibrionaceae bacterium]